VTPSESGSGVLRSPAGKQPNGSPGIFVARNGRQPHATLAISALTGIRSSKPIFYAEYRHTLESLDRMMRSLDRVAGVLVATDQGPQALCREVVDAVADHLGASWVVLALRPTALPDTATRLVARDPDGAIRLDAHHLPAHVLALVNRALAQPAGIVSGGTEVFVPLRVAGAIQGVLGALADRADANPLRVDDADLRMLTVLANQAVASLQSDDALRRNEQLLARSEELYDKANARARALAERHRQLQEARKSLDLARRQQAVDDERRRLARELHDSVAQQVLSAGMAVEWCRSQVASGSPVHVKLEHAKRFIRTALEQLRSSIQTLSDSNPGSDEDLPAMLRRLQAYHATADFDLTMHIAGPTVPLTVTTKQALFRIASECLFNTAVHARARRATVRLSYARDTVRLEVADDGDGAPATLRRIVRGEVPGTGRGYHRGIADIAARVEDLRGTLAVDRSDLGGIRVDVLLPLTSVPAHELPSGGSDG
jgi:signal transduction histidine kinase